MIERIALTSAALLAAALIAFEPPMATAAAGESGTSRGDIRACEPARAHPAGLSEHDLEFGGTTRRVSLYVPRSYSGGQAVPVVFDLHATGISPRIELQVTGFDRAAEKTGFVVVLPAAVTPAPDGGTTWNIPYRRTGADDVGFIRDTLTWISRTLCIDETRIYATGFSGGARLASELACRLPDRFAAVGAVAGLRHPRGDEGACVPGSRTVPIIAFHSTDDPVNPYDHDAERSAAYWTYGVEEALTRWREERACPAPAADRISDDVVRLRFADCEAGATVEFYRLSRTGHTWPGSGFPFPAYLGPTEDAIDATALTVRFFGLDRPSAD